MNDVIHLNDLMEEIEENLRGKTPSPDAYLILKGLILIAAALREGKG